MRLRISKQELLRRREIRRQREKQLQDDRRNDIIEASKIGFVYGLICGALSYWILSSAIRRSAWLGGWVLFSILAGVALYIFLEIGRVPPFRWVALWAILSFLILFAIWICVLLASSA
jgi:apolipoprotein N-acyltransferase